MEIPSAELSRDLSELDSVCRRYRDPATTRVKRETRARRIEKFVAMLGRRETIDP